jgi:predicted nucleotidyltransferase
MPRSGKNTSFARYPMDKILGGAGGVRVMRALLAHGGALSVSRLAEDTRMTPDGVRGVLSDLERARVVEGLGSGRTRLFQAIASHPLVAALDTLFTAERSRFDEIIDTVKAATADPRIVATWLFGSVARGEDTVDSDLDIAIVIDADPGQVDTIADRVRDALLEHERRSGFSASVVSMSLADVARLSSERTPLWRNLLTDALVLQGFAPAVAVGRAASHHAARNSHRRRKPLRGG